MKIPRRQFLQAAASVVALPATSRIARAQAYPSRPVRIIVVAAAGGAADITARQMGQWLSERLGQQFFVENRTGAGGNIGTEAVVRASPDGYTLLLVGLNNAISATLYEKLNFDFIRDIAPVAAIIRAPNVMEVNPAVPAKTVPEFIAYAKANPGKINMASAGIGTGNHLFGALFGMMAGTNMIHVPYRGDMFPDLIGGQVQVYFGAMGASIELIRAGKLPALAVTTATRWEGTPDIPTVDEFVLGYEASVCRSGSRHLVMLGHPAIKLRKVPQSAQRFDQHLTQRTHSLTVGSTPHISGGSSFLRKQSRMGCQHRRFLHLAAGTPALGGTVNFDS